MNKKVKEAVKVALNLDNSKQEAVPCTESAAKRVAVRLAQVPNFLPMSQPEMDTYKKAHPNWKFNFNLMEGIRLMIIDLNSQGKFITTPDMVNEIAPNDLPARLHRVKKSVKDVFGLTPEQFGQIGIDLGYQTEQDLEPSAWLKVTGKAAVTRVVSADFSALLSAKS